MLLAPSVFATLCLSVVISPFFSCFLPETIKGMAEQLFCRANTAKYLYSSGHITLDPQNFGRQQQAADRSLLNDCFQYKKKGSSV